MKTKTRCVDCGASNPRFKSPCAATGDLHVTRPSISCRWCGSKDRCDCVDRADCPKAGERGHRTCGWCSKHVAPVFTCPAECWNPHEGRKP